MKNTSILSFILTLIAFNLSYSQAPDILWSQTFGGSSADFGFSGQQTSDEGYIVAGHTESFGGGNDAWLIKTDAEGNEVWNQTFGGSNSDYFTGIQQTSDEGFIMTGFTNSFGGGNYDAWLVKTDAEGNEMWSETFGGGEGDWGYSVQQTSDGGYIVTGYTLSYGAGEYDAWLIKTDTDGNEVWSKTFGGSASDQGMSGQQTSDGGYIVTGYTYSYGAGGSDVWLIKTDAAGNEVWNQTFGGSEDDIGYSVQQTSDGDYILAGYTLSYGAGNGDIWLIKIDTDGNEVWNQTFGGSADDLGSSVQQTSEGGYIITGYTGSYGAGSWDVWLIKTDAEGNEVWNQTYGGSNLDRGYHVQQTTDGGYIIIGWTQSFGAGDFDVLLIKIESETIGIDNLGLNISKSIYPNPSNGLFTITPNFDVESDNIKIEITNLTGKIVYTSTFSQKNQDQITIDLSKLNSGVYLLKYFVNNNYHIHTIVKQ
ncbi:MAG: T9SS type A sorting domain-containing protein [Bacteroidota bacterium]